MDHHEMTHQANYSSSERKLKRITQELPFNPPPTQLIEDKINQMRMKIALKNEGDRRTITETNGSELPKPIQRLNTQNTQQYPQMASLLTDRISKASLLNRTNESKAPSRAYQNSRRHVQSYKQECIARDKHKNPLKYKIIQEEVGLSNERKVYNLKQDQIHRIQEQFMRRKGLEYLREGNNAAQHVQTQKFYTNTAKGRASSLKFNTNSTSKIHQIFNNPISQSKRIKSEKSLKKRVKSKLILEELKEQEEMLGKIVFQKVKKHLKEQKKDPNYFRRVYSEQTINDALVDFLRIKIQRAQASLGK